MLEYEVTQKKKTSLLQMLLLTADETRKCENRKPLCVKTNGSHYEIHVEKPTDDKHIGNHPKYNRWQHQSGLFLKLP